MQKKKKNKSIKKVIKAIVSVVFISLRHFNCHTETASNHIYHKQNTSSSKYFQVKTEPKLVIIIFVDRLLAPLTDSILVEAAHQPQFPCPKVSRKTAKWIASKLHCELRKRCSASLMRRHNLKPHSPNIR